MQIVVNITEKEYESIKKHPNWHSLGELIAHGTPLPKGHGRFIDADELLKHVHIIGTSNYCEYDVVYVETIKEAPTIIEADKEQEE